MILKIVIAGVCVCLISSLLKKNFEQTVLLLQIAFFVIVFAFAANELKNISDSFSEYMSYIDGGSEFISCLIKGACICILTKISCDICKDSGNTAVSDIIDLSGRIAMIYLAFPYVNSVIKTAVSFVS